MPDIKHFIIIDGPPGPVFDAVSTSEGVANWWETDVSGGPNLGDVQRIRFETGGGAELKIVEREPETRFTWEVVGGPDEWIGSTISFDLESVEGRTQVRFGHDGWKECTDLFAGCNYFWGYFMRSLKQYVETGVGTPITPEQIVPKL